MKNNLLILSVGTNRTLYDVSTGKYYRDLTFSEGKKAHDVKSGVSCLIWVGAFLVSAIIISMNIDMLLRQHIVIYALSTIAIVIVSLLFGVIFANLYIKRRDIVGNLKPLDISGASDIQKIALKASQQQKQMLGALVCTFVFDALALVFMAVMYNQAGQSTMNYIPPFLSMMMFFITAALLKILTPIKTQRYIVANSQAIDDTIKEYGRSHFQLKSSLTFEECQRALPGEYTSANTRWRAVFYVDGANARVKMKNYQFNRVYQYSAASWDIKLKASGPETVIDCRRIPFSGNLQFKGILLVLVAVIVYASFTGRISLMSNPSMLAFYVVLILLFLGVIFGSNSDSKACLIEILCDALDAV
jgi:hypothetical protein